MFRTSFGGMFETYKVIFEIYIRDKLSNKQIMEAPKEMLMINFVQTAQQVGNDNRPIKLRMIRQDEIWDNFEQKIKPFNYEVEFKNNAMIVWEESGNTV